MGLKNYSRSTTKNVKNAKVQENKPIGQKFEFSIDKIAHEKECNVDCISDVGTRATGCHEAEGLSGCLQSLTFLNKLV